MDDDWKKNHIPISPDKIRHTKKKSRRPPPPSEEDQEEELENEIIVAKLIESLNESVEYCQRKQKIIEEDFLLTIHTKIPISYGQRVLLRFGMDLAIQQDEKSAIVITNKESLGEFKKALQEYRKTGRLGSYIENIDSFSKADFSRLSSELVEWTTPNDLRNIEIEFLPNLNQERYSTLISNLRAFITSKGDEIFCWRIRDETASIRGKMKPNTAKAIAQGVDSVWKTKSAPIITIEKPQNIPFDKRRTETRIITPKVGAKTVCVLDTGVDKNNPLLSKVIVSDIDLTKSGSPNDNNGHGTFVSGLAAYGNFEVIEPYASAKIISVKVHEPHNKNLHGYLEDRIEKAVIKYHNQSKIFNLSIMYEICGEVEEPSNLAHTLDQLSSQYGVIFTVSSGNIKKELKRLINSSSYPQYFKDKSCRIFSGGEGCNSITVGGIANKESYLSIAKKNQPSPFTRRGEFNNRCKPDVVSSAGNLEQKNSDNSINIFKNNDLGVVSLGKAPSVFAIDWGTSFASAAVSNILAKLSEIYPKASPNLLKALVIHFSSWPDESSSFNASQNLKSSLYGKGVPNFEKCAYSTTSCATYFVESSIKYNDEAWIPIFVPQRMKEIYGEKIMRVTLVYDPPVDKGIIGYTLADLDFKLFKALTPQGNNKWSHSFKNRWDNVKTGLFRWQKRGWGKMWTIMVSPTVRFRERIDRLEQDFALVVTLEDPHKQVNIYDAILKEIKRPLVRETLVPYIQNVQVAN